MQTICIIDPSPTARATLAARLREEFTVVEEAALAPAIASSGARLVVAAAESLRGSTIDVPPFATLPFVILGDPGDATTLGRPAPVYVLGRNASAGDVVGHARTLLANGARGTAPAADEIDTPFLPYEVAEGLRRLAAAHTIPLPVLITGEAGTGKRTAARSLHAAAAHGTFLRITSLTAARILAGPTSAPGPGGPITLLIDGVDRVPVDAQAALVEVIETASVSGSADASRPWIVATTTADLAALADADRFDAALAARLGELVISIPPLRTRPQAIAAIARHVLADLARSTGRAFELDAGALDLLRQYQWPGNLGELVAVLRRTALLCRRDLVHGEDVMFSVSTIPTLRGPATASGFASAHHVDEVQPHDPATEGATTAAPAGTAPALQKAETAGDNGAALELILTQLAHELKNPMVTIKTFAHHLPALLEDPELRQRFATLADEAIDRMDGLLDNVLDFARFGFPRTTRLSLTHLLDGAVQAIETELARRSATVRRDGWNRNGDVVADEAQIAYAFRNLFESLIAEVSLERELRLEVDGTGTARIRFKGAPGVAAKLRGFLEPDTGVPAASAFPLRLALARAAIDRNRGRMTVETETDHDTVITITLPAAVHGG